MSFLIPIRSHEEPSIQMLIDGILPSVERAREEFVAAMAENPSAYCMDSSEAAGSAMAPTMELSESCIIASNRCAQIAECHAWSERVRELNRVVSESEDQMVERQLSLKIVADDAPLSETKAESPVEKEIEKKVRVEAKKQKVDIQKPSSEEIDWQKLAIGSGITIGAIAVIYALLRKV